jgi:hypothetical protein
MAVWVSAELLLRAVAEQEAAELDRLAAQPDGVTPSWDCHENQERLAASPSFPLSVREGTAIPGQGPGFGSGSV